MAGISDYGYELIQGSLPMLEAKAVERRDAMVPVEGMAQHFISFDVLEREGFVHLFSVDVPNRSEQVHVYLCQGGNCAE